MVTKGRNAGLAGAEATGGEGEEGMNVERRNIVQHEYLITLDETEAATFCRLMGLRNSLERFCHEFHGE